MANLYSLLRSFLGEIIVYFCPQIAFSMTNIGDFFVEQNICVFYRGPGVLDLEHNPEHDCVPPGQAEHVPITTDHNVILAIYSISN